MFWAEARNKAVYESFEDLVTFDTIYLTNKYKMPFAPFVGEPLQSVNLIRMQIDI